MASNNGALNLQRFIVSVVIVGVVLILGIYLSSAINNTVDTPNVLVTKLNESGTFNALNSPITLVGAASKDGVCGSLTSATNATATGKPIGLGNFTQVGCTVVNATKIFGFAGSNVWNASYTIYLSYTYTYSQESSASNAANELVSALSTGTSWISILVVVGFATVILTMLTSGLGAAARKEDGVPYY